MSEDQASGRYPHSKRYRTALFNFSEDVIRRLRPLIHVPSLLEREGEKEGVPGPVLAGVKNDGRPSGFAAAVELTYPLVLEAIEPAAVLSLTLQQNGAVFGFEHVPWTDSEDVGGRKRQLVMVKGWGPEEDAPYHLFRRAQRLRNHGWVSDIIYIHAPSRRIMAMEKLYERYSHRLSAEERPPWAMSRLPQIGAELLGELEGYKGPISVYAGSGVTQKRMSGVARYLRDRGFEVEICSEFGQWPTHDIVIAPARLTPQYRETFRKDGRRIRFVAV